MSAWPTYSDLLDAYQKCRLRKQPSPHQLYFESKLGENLNLLLHEIHTRTYCPSRTVCFIVTHPKPREVFAAHFRDRIIHHLVVGQLEPLWEKKLIYSSFACRKRKGPDRARQYLCSQVRSISQGGRKEVFVLQMDIASFFATISRSLLLSLILQPFKNPSLIFLIKASYSHDARKHVWMQSSQEHRQLIPWEKSWFNQSEDQGLPIGNLTSQFGANVYLNALDHFALRSMKADAYLRYMDDLTFLDRSAEKLYSMIQPLEKWLQKNRKQNFQPKKTFLKSMNEGIDYLGYHIKQSPITGRVELFTPPKKKWEFIQVVRLLEREGMSDLKPFHPLGFPSRDKTAQNTLDNLNSRLGVLKHSRSYCFRKNVLTRLESRFTNPEKIPSDFFDPYCPLRFKSHYRSVKLK
jgi:RNA-directed DNA polymerase